VAAVLRTREFRYGTAPGFRGKKGAINVVSGRRLRRGKEEFETRLRQGYILFWGEGAAGTEGGNSSSEKLKKGATLRGPVPKLERNISQNSREHPTAKMKKCNQKASSECSHIGGEGGPMRHRSQGCLRSEVVVVKLKEVKTAQMKEKNNKVGGKRERLWVAESNSAPERKELDGAAFLQVK